LGDSTAHVRPTRREQVFLEVPSHAALYRFIHRGVNTEYWECPLRRRTIHPELAGANAICRKTERFSDDVIIFKVGVTSVARGLRRGDVIESPRFIAIDVEIVVQMESKKGAFAVDLEFLQVQ